MKRGRFGHEHMPKARELIMKVVTAAEVRPQEVNTGGFLPRTGTYRGKRIFTGDASDGHNSIIGRNEFVHIWESAFQTLRLD